MAGRVRPACERGFCGDSAGGRDPGTGSVPAGWVTCSVVLHAQSGSSMLLGRRERRRAAAFLHKRITEPIGLVPDDAVVSFPGKRRSGLRCRFTRLGLPDSPALFLCGSHFLPGSSAYCSFGAEGCRLRHFLIYSRHPLRRPSHALAAGSGGQPFDRYNRLLNLFPLGPEFGQHLKDVHATQYHIRSAILYDQNSRAS
jgi:hypothetical protein